MSKKKERLKPISFYPHKPEDVIRAFLRVDPERVKEKERQREKKNNCKKEKEDK